MKVVIAVVVVSCGIFGLLGYLSHLEHESALVQEKREQAWLIFSQQNHCSVVREAGFWDANVTWQCDGNFQVRRWR